MNKTVIKLYLKKSKFLLIILLLLLAFTEVSLAKYKKTIDVGTINVTVEPELKTYDITGTNKILAQHHFTSGNATLEETGATHFNKPMEITSEGLYINDTSSTYNCWCLYSFVEEDGYTSSFDPSHIYYARSEIKLVSYTSGYLCFGFSNAQHAVGQNGIQSKLAKVTEVTDTHQVVSLWTVPIQSGSGDYTRDYMDSVQIGSANGSIVTGYFKNFMLLDLTQIFGEGNEPPQEWCDENIGYDTTTISWFAEEEQSLLNDIPELYYPSATVLSTFSFRDTEEVSAEESLDTEITSDDEENSNEDIINNTDVWTENSNDTTIEINNSNTDVNIEPDANSSNTIENTQTDINETQVE